mmetsp:Transcript_22026/g.61301  ORF Transcript_22026/g.61301 Transcript_22026/m.61301 type:complete len:321 (+) Transcript_22026:1525-2487(+)
MLCTHTHTRTTRTTSRPGTRRRHRPLLDDIVQKGVAGLVDFLPLRRRSGRRFLARKKILAPKRQVDASLQNVGFLRNAVQIPGLAHRVHDHQRSRLQFETRPVPPSICLAADQESAGGAQTDRGDRRGPADLLPVGVPSDALVSVLVKVEQTNVERRDVDIVVVVVVVMLALVPVLAELSEGLDNFRKAIDVGEVVSWVDGVVLIVVVVVGVANANRSVLVCVGRSNVVRIGTAIGISIGTAISIGISISIVAVVVSVAFASAASFLVQADPSIDLGRLFPRNQRLERLVVAIGLVLGQKVWIVVDAGRFEFSDHEFVHD